MKRRQRRPVLTLNKPYSNYHVEHTQNRCKPVSNVQPAQNESNNPLANLLCQYNSDSDPEDSKKDTQKLDDQVNDFLKEIQLIAPEQPASNAANDASVASKVSSQPMHHTNQHTLWQECYDQVTGYPYYWHVETNDVQWDMPEELRLLRKQSEMASSGVKSSIQGPHWVDFSSIAYRQSQANIPEGMIPQEVVARNRNRFLHNETPKRSNLESKPEIKNESPAKDDDSDDGPIEMITFYGGNGSDSEDENNSSDEKKTPKQSLSESTNSDSAASYLKSGEIGPVFCPREIQSHARNLPRPVYKSDLSASSSTNQSEPKQCEQKTAESDGKSCVTQGEKEFSMEAKNRKEINAVQNAVPKLDFKVSLVPGYGDDSDGEEEIRPKQEVKPLFPISQDEEYVSKTKSSTNVHDGFAKDSNNVQSGDQNDDSCGDTQEVKDDHEKMEKESKPDEDKSKTNIFLEDMQVCGKAFQRKKRIAFDVTSTKIKRNNVCDNVIEDDISNSDPANGETVSHNTEDGDYQSPSVENQKESDKGSSEQEQCAGVKSEEKSDTKDESCEEEDSAEPKAESTVADEKDNAELSDLSQIIGEKLKFLSEGRESVSAVQTMQIQLQTLSTAWTAASLEESYFQKWLTSTNHELERLEQDAAPAGWLCQWDRSHKRYYYHNTSTGTSQWTYPDTGIAGGTEEMELCTPPPPESEELSITESPGTKKTKEKQAEDADDIKMDADGSAGERRPTDIEAPPPPQISNPSPPPPPRIFAEDLKKDKKKRERPDDKPFDVKRRRLGKDRIASLETTQVINPALESLSYAHPQAAVSPQTSIPSSHASMEPLPPGVDLPDTCYEAATLKGIIYNASQQSNAALYAPSIGDPTIPILSHQAGLLQEPFVHYPGFHQHLHNQTIAVANKHSGQNAIQFMMGYAPIYTNNKIIAKPPVKASKESLGSALNSFYNDIARIEKKETEARTGQHQDAVAATTSAATSATPAAVEQVSAPTEETKPETESECATGTETSKEMTKEKKKKKVARIGISKKHKEMSTMVAKWQRVQKNLEDTV